MVFPSYLLLETILILIFAAICFITKRIFLYEGKEKKMREKKYFDTPFLVLICVSAISNFTNVVMSVLIPTTIALIINRKDYLSALPSFSDSVIVSSIVEKFIETIEEVIREAKIAKRRIKKLWRQKTIWVKRKLIDLSPSLYWKQIQIHITKRIYRNGTFVFV